MKTKKSNRDEVRENTLVIPMTREEKLAVKKAAEEMGTTMCSFVRIILKERLKNH